MFDSVDATGYVRPMGSGRTKPVLLVVERADGTEVEAVVKFSQGAGIGGLIREALSAMLLHDLDLPVPEPFAVTLEQDFIASVPSASVREQMAASSSIAFGSRLLPASFALWVSTGGKLDPGLDAEALNILAFDCWATNGDRRIQNNNVLTNGREFAVIDHELSLGHALINLFWKPPWIPNVLDNALPPNDHVFFSPLRGRGAYDISALTAKLGALTDGRIDLYGAAIPGEWVAAEPQTVSETIIFLKQLRDHAGEASKEFVRAMG